jgi:hypothetical protein
MLPAGCLVYLFRQEPRKEAFMNTKLHKFGTSLAAGAALIAVGSPLLAAERNSTARHVYLQERATCLSGQSHQPREVCLREAAAAYAEAKRGDLGHEDPAQLQANALARCAVRPPDQMAMCERMARGEGTVTGSVEEGGFVRQIVTRVE